MPHSHTPVAALERIRFLPNWPVKALMPKQYLVLGAGHQLDAIATWFAADTQAQNVGGVKVGLVWEVNQTPGEFISLRIRNTDREVHHAATDLTLRRQGNDLFVRLETNARSMLTCLKRLVMGGVVFTGWALTYALYLSVTDTYDAVVQEYVRKYNPQEINEFAEAIKLGYQIDEGGELYWPGPGKGIGFWEMARSDPMLFFGQIAAPAGVIAGLFGAALFMIPKAYYYLPCRFLGWPTPEQFESFVTAHNGWVENMLSYILFQRFGVGQDRILPS